jgi:glutathione S-transferase
MLRLFDYLDSGNGYKVRLLLHQLGLPFELVEKDILAGETRTPAFLAINPNGRVPVLELEDGRHLAESNAILHYLAEGTPFLPVERFARAQVLQWLFFEQYSHEPNIATLRFWMRHGGADDPARAPLVSQKRAQGHAALGVMEGHLARREYFVEGRYTIADIALYAYTHVADQGGFDLAGYPAVRAWLARVQARPGHLPMLAP